MNEKEEASYWFKMSDNTYSAAMDMLEISDSYYQKGIEITKSKRKED